jgi:hypothetical protein
MSVKLPSRTFGAEDLPKSVPKMKRFDPSAYALVIIG